MLHIILGILKVIGILLLAVLGLFLLGILAVLFVPVRYRIAGKKEKEQLEGRICLSWLCHVISLAADYSEKQLSICVKLFGISLKCFGGAKTGAGKRSSKKKQRKKQQDLARKKPALKETEEEAETKKMVSEQLRPEETEAEKTDTEKKTPGRAKPETKGVLDLLDAAAEFLEAGEEKLERLGTWKSALDRIIQPFLTDASKALYGRLFVYLKNLWKHYRIRKIQGWMHYGTGESDLTGELTGLLYLILPGSADRFSLQPEFTERVLELDITAEGHIRACHLGRTAWLLWREKELKKLIRRVRAKGGKEDGR